MPESQRQKANQRPLSLWRGSGWNPARSLFSSPLRVPALPVKNLNGTGPVHPALAGEVRAKTREVGGTHKEAGPTCPPLGLRGGAHHTCT